MTRSARSGRQGATLAGAALAGLLAAAGCTHTASDPKPAAFAPGTCRSVAAPILDIGQVIRPVLGHPKKAYAAAPALTRAQDRLRAAQRTDRASSTRLEPLVSAIGYYRMTVIGHTYTDAEGRAIDAAQRKLVTACTAGS